MLKKVDNTLPGRFAIILQPGFSLLTLGSLTQVLHKARTRGASADTGFTLHAENPPDISSTCGTILTGLQGLDELATGAAIALIGADFRHDSVSDRLIARLRRAARFSPLMIGFHGGIHALAKAGLLDGFRVAAHWSHIDSLRECFPLVEWTEDLYRLDRNRMTCAGEGATHDAMIGLMAAHLGEEAAASISDDLISHPIRAGCWSQRSSLATRTGTRHPKLLEAIRLSEESIESPIGVMDLAARVGLSRRQVERLFRMHLGQSPVRFREAMQLEKARELLIYSDLGISEVAVACGFRCTARLSRAYARRFFKLPSQERGVLVIQMA